MVARYLDMNKGRESVTVCASRLCSLLGSRRCAKDRRTQNYRVGGKELQIFRFHGNFVELRSPSVHIAVNTPPFLNSAVSSKLGFASDLVEDGGEEQGGDGTCRTWSHGVDHRKGFLVE